MRRVGYYITLTTDGMYADPDGGLGDFDPAEEEHRFANELVRDAGDAVMGRVMYDVMDYWDDLDLDDPDTSDVEREFATFWRETPEARRIARRARRSARTPTGSRAMSSTTSGGCGTATGPTIMLGAGADLFAQLVQADLIDDFRLPHRADGARRRARPCSRRSTSR